MIRAALKGTVVLAVIAAVGAGAVWGVVTFLRSLDAEPRAAERCTALNDDVRHPLSHEQADTAALLAASVLHRGMPARAATISIATAMQESSMRNIDYGDRDSLGLFQQRPSQGWGTAEEIMDPVYSTHTFLDALAEVDGYESMEITVAAQTVQRSAFPEAYAQHETMSRAWASALTGHSSRAVTCVVHDVPPGDLDVVLARVERDFGDLGVSVLDEGVAVELDASLLAGRDGDGAPRLAWAVAQWGVAVAPTLGLAEVAVGEDRWTPAGPWSTIDTDAVPPGVVRLTLHR